MNIKKQWQEWVDECAESESYRVESAKLDFAISLEKQRKSSDLSYAELAKLIKTSAAYISKVFRGDSNLTIESMVKLALATGGELKIEIVKKEELVKISPADAFKIAMHQSADISNVIHFTPGKFPISAMRKATFTTITSSYTFDGLEASNGDSLSLKAA